MTIESRKSVTLPFPEGSKQRDNLAKVRELPIGQLSVKIKVFSLPIPSFIIQEWAADRVGLVDEHLRNSGTETVVFTSAIEIVNYVNNNAELKAKIK